MGLFGCQLNPVFDPTNHVCDLQTGCPGSFTCSPATLTCVPTSGASSGTSSSTSGSTSSSTGGCAAGIMAYSVKAALRYAQVQPCHGNADCCNQTCVSDPYLAAQPADAGLAPTVCESACTQTADCHDSNAVCRDGLCRINYCGATPIDGGPVNGTWGGLCDAGDGLGTCVDFQAVGSGPAGLCTLAGMAGAAGCDLSLYPAFPALLCPLGQACLLDGGPNLAGDAGTLSACVDTCDPEADGGCPTGLSCTCATSFSGGSHGHIGYCTDGGATRCL